MSGVGSCETGLDSLFASKPVGPGFEPCLGQSAKLAGAPKPLCLSVCLPAGQMVGGTLHSLTVLLVRWVCCDEHCAVDMKVPQPAWDCQ